MTAAQQGKGFPAAAASSVWELWEAAPDATIVMSEDGRIHFVNEQTLCLFGYAGSELLDQPIEVLLPDRFRQAHAGHRSSYRSDRQQRLMGRGLELFGRRKDGTEFQAEIALSPVRSAEGAFVIAAVRDVTARKQAEAATVKRATQLADMSRACAEVVPNKRALVELLARKVSEITDDAFCVIRLLTDDRSALELIAMHHPDPELRAALRRATWTTTLRADLGAWKPIIEERKAFRSAPSQRVPPGLSTTEAAFVKKFAPSHVDVVPLVARGQVIGGMAIWRFNDRPLANDDEALVGDLADRAAMLIDNARLFESLTDELALRRRAEAEAIKASALQNAIFQSTTFSCIATDAKGIVQLFNVGAERMLGYVAADVIDKLAASDLHDPMEMIARAKALSVEVGPPIASGFEALVFKASRGLEDITELTKVRKDGSRFPAMVSITALRDAESAIIGYLLICTDNSARRQVEDERAKLDQRLRDQQFYTRSLIESNIDALVTTDPSGIITDANRQMEALTGCTRDELIGAPFKNYFTDPHQAEAGIKLVLTKRKVTDYELTACARDGTKTVVSYNATTFYDRNRTLQGVFAAARDVTEDRHRNTRGV